MATIRTLTDLFRAISSQDLPRANSIATQICAMEERRGHGAAARLLRGALHANGEGCKKVPSPVLESEANFSALPSTVLTRLPAEPSLKDVVLPPSGRRTVESIVNEWKKREVLWSRRLKPRSKLLFYGVPGCGKSLTARAIAHELSIPIYLVRFDAIIGAYLGQTAIHLRQLFHFVESAPSVLLLDELDALGKRRGNPQEVGELDRIVIALMQELEHSRPLGLIIGTSNLPQHLDDALWRRFDIALEFKLPRKEVLSAYAREVARSLRISLNRDVLRNAVSAKTFADAEAVVVAEARRLALLEK